MELSVGKTITYDSSIGENGWCGGTCDVALALWPPFERLRASPLESLVSWPPFEHFLRASPFEHAGCLTKGLWLWREATCTSLVWKGMVRMFWIPAVTGVGRGSGYIDEGLCHS